MTQIIAVGTKCKLKNTGGDRLNGFSGDDIVTVAARNGNCDEVYPINVTKPGKSGYCNPSQLEVLFPQPSEARGRFAVGDKVRVIKIVSDASEIVKVGDVCTVSRLRDSGEPRNVTEHAGWDFVNGVFAPLVVTPFDDEIARMKVALADLEAKAQASIGPVWEKAKREMVGKLCFLRESGRVMALAGLDPDGQAHFRAYGDRSTTHNPYPSHADSDCRLATRAEILASAWVPAE